MSRAPVDIQQFGRLNDLFARACDLPEAERRALLDRECAGDAALRAKLAELLHLDGASGSSQLESPLIGAELGNVVRRLASMDDVQAALPAQLGRLTPRGAPVRLASGSGPANKRPVR